MIDMFALVVSLGMTAIVVFFALRMNRDRDWFERPGTVRRPPPPRPSRFPSSRPAPRR